MAWKWQYLSSDGNTLPPTPENLEFPNQSDAETWLGETWRELREQGVASVTLFEDDREVYGPMSLFES